MTLGDKLKALRSSFGGEYFTEDQAECAAAASLAHFRDALTREKIAETLWKAGAIRDLPVGAFSEADQFERDYAYGQADAVLALLDAAGT